MQFFFPLIVLFFNKKSKKIDNKSMKPKLKLFYFFLTSIFVGIINGIFGGGGGMLCVPFLKILLNLNDKQAHATTVLVMSIISIPTLIVYISTQAFSFFNAIFLTFGVIVGGIIGSKILNKINNETLNIIFIILMLSVGIKMLF